MLTRPLYRGEVTWNRTRKRNAWGIKRQTGRAEAEWIQLELPALRIVPETLWQAVRERFRDARGWYLRATNGQLWGRPANGIESRYLLTGLAQCGRCGGSLIVHSRASGGRRAHAYLCSYHHLRGNTVCPDGLILPMNPTNEAVLTTVEQEVLHPEVVRRALRLVLDQLSAPTDTSVPRRIGLQAELAVGDECHGTGDSPGLPTEHETVRHRSGKHGPLGPMPILRPSQGTCIERNPYRPACSSWHPVKCNTGAGAKHHMGVRTCRIRATVRGMK